MRLQHFYYTSSRKYTELFIATLAALFALAVLAALDSSVAAQSLPAAPQTTATVSTASGVKALAAVSAASFQSNEIAPESIVAAFGSELSTTAQVNDAWPLPYVLAGTSVKLRDAAGRAHDAPLFFVAPEQVNFFIPPGVAFGEATVTITSGDGALSQGTLQLVDCAPGLFAMNGNGAGVAAATVLRVRGSAHYFEIMARFDVEANQWMTLPIAFGPSADRVFLALYGTGIRGRASLSNVTMTIGGASVPVSYAGAQGSLFGLDQVNVEIPRALAGRGEVEVALTINGKAANTVKISLN